MSLDEAAQTARTARSEADARSRREQARQLERRIAVVLRTGVLAATAVLVVSLPWIVFGDGSTGGRLSVGDALRRLPDRDPRAFAAIGVLIVVATPVVQLLTSVVLFWRKRDRLYVGLTIIVCLIVATGALFTGGGH